MTADTHRHTHTHTHQRGMRAAEKAKTREDTTEEHLIEGEREREGGRESVVGEKRKRQRERTGDHEDDGVQPA